VPPSEVGQHVEKPIGLDRRVEVSQVSAKELREDKNLRGGSSQVSAPLEEKLLAECRYIVGHPRVCVVGRQAGNRVSEGVPGEAE